MTFRIRDAILAAGVGAALITTGQAFHDLGRRLPPAPSVGPSSPTAETKQPLLAPSPGGCPEKDSVTDLEAGAVQVAVR
jgi:hypothetical protein